MSVMIYIGLLALYTILPMPVQALVFLADVLVPDPIPFFDEIILFLVLAAKIQFYENVLDFLEGPGCIVAIILFIALLALAGYGGVKLFQYVF